MEKPRRGDERRCAHAGIPRFRGKTAASGYAGLWIASRSLPSGAHSRAAVARMTNPPATSATFETFGLPGLPWRDVAASTRLDCNLPFHHVTVSHDDPTNAAPRKDETLLEPYIRALGRFDRRTTCLGP